jgi:hypothetical protein
VADVALPCRVILLFCSIVITGLPSLAALNVYIYLLPVLEPEIEK